MVDRPGLELSLCSADSFAISGPFRDRVAQFAHIWAAHRNGGDLPRCHLRVDSAVPEHHGLGVGTQLAMSVAAALDAWAGCVRRSAEELAESVGRIGRSSVGAHGFIHGGLIMELGRRAGESLAPLERHVFPPDNWRVLVLTEAGRPGLFGAQEQQVLGQLPEVPREHSAAMIQEASQSMFPAAATGDFAEFSASVARYGQMAGTCFVGWQKGTYANPRVAARAEILHRLGVTGVAQSSWGPTLFAIAESEQHANWLLRRLAAEPIMTNVTKTVSLINRQGYQLAHDG
ncbi:MAG: hypothetical protein O2931_12525 [Planctomycetota bacterium]|nr:hypothetical protein [Planctomycetota bacterium]MDA1179611.1 hypothetical protein [Planctomycetota bacterium]